MKLIAELRRRNVFRVAVAYLVVAWVILQVGDLASDSLGFPGWFMPMLFVLLGLGLPVALVLSWAFELTPQGMERTETAAEGAAASVAPSASPTAGRVLNVVILAGLVLLAGYFVWESRFSGAAPDDAAPGPVAASVAVLPFDNLSNDPEQGYFADGLTEEILNALAVLPDLRVTARTSSFYYRDRDVPVGEIGERLGVEHVLEGSVRRGGERIRVTAQLVRADDGFHVWSSTYDRSVEDVFAVQTDIAEKVASALGILLDEERRALMEGAGVQNPEAYALFARGVELYRLAHGDAPQLETLREANRFFDEASALAPDLWAASYWSADLYTHILLQLAAGADPASLPRPEVERAREEHEARLAAAMRVAPNDAARDFIDITRRLFSDDWTGLGPTVGRAFGHTEACGYDQWMHLLGPAFGMADEARDFFLRGTVCNRLDEANWIHASLASLHAGDPARALEIAERGIDVADVEGSELESDRISALLALGRHGEARASLSRLSGDPVAHGMAGASLAATTGDRERLAALRAELRAELGGEGAGGVREVREIQLAAWAGDREAANARAAAVDARPAGPAHLLIAIYFCHCGAPFDLAAVPRLAARLEEAGVEWPPTPILPRPLKGG